MSRYGDDQCERCGGVRVAKSTLCAACLVKERAYLEKEILIKGVTIEMLRTKLETQTGYLDDALKYGFQKNQENMKLHQYIRELKERIHKEWREKS